MSTLADPELPTNEAVVLLRYILEHRSDDDDFGQDALLRMGFEYLEIPRPEIPWDPV